jgi:hypothetical protein
MKKCIRNSISSTWIFRHHLLTPVLICVLLGSLFACSSNPPKRRGASLSEAAKEAEKKPEDQKVIEPEEGVVHEDPDYEVGAVGIALGVVESELLTSDQPQPMVQASSRDPWHIGLVFGGGSLTGDEVDGFLITGVQGGVFFIQDRARVDIRGLVMPTNLTAASGIAGGLQDEVEFAFDVAARLYATPAHTFMGLYGTGGLRLGILTFRYKNPILVDDGFGDIDTIHGDNIKYLAPFLGFGVTLMQTRFVHVGGNLTGGYKFYEGITGEGFSNDVLDDEFFAQVMLNLTLVFGH